MKKNELKNDYKKFGIETGKEEILGLRSERRNLGEQCLRVYN